MACIKDLLELGVCSLRASSASPELDASLLLAFVLDRETVYLRTWPEREVEASAQGHFEQLISQRAAGEPVAYLLGYKEFWTHRFAVDRHTLIPRPETELLVELALQLLPNEASLRVADLGTGSGAIAISLAKHSPRWTLCATDLSLKALEKAHLNARQLQANNVYFYHGPWYQGFQKRVFSASVTESQAADFQAAGSLSADGAVGALDKFDAIISNPPYIAFDDPHLSTQVANSEPRQALIAAQQGYADLDMIIAEAGGFLKPNGWLLLEHGFQQGEGVRELLARGGFEKVKSHRDLGGHERCTLGRYSLGS